ncbi:hypothetical protein [Streptomyces sp. NPDC054794]
MSSFASSSPDLSPPLAGRHEYFYSWATTPQSAFGVTRFGPAAYGIRLDAWNHAKPGVDLPLTLNVRRAKGAAPSTLTSTRAWYSLDGGLHWIQLGVHRRGPSTARVA